MTNQSTDETDQSAMPVISYAPVEDDRSMNRLFRLAMGWFFILEFAYWALSDVLRFVPAIARTAGFTSFLNSPIEVFGLGISVLRIGCALGLSLCGWFMIKRKPDYLSVTRSLLIGHMVTSLIYSLAMVWSYLTLKSGMPWAAHMSYVISTVLGIPGGMILPIFLLVLINPKIAALYK